MMMVRALLFIVISSICAQAHAQVTSTQQYSPANSNMRFEENRGQIADADGVVQKDILFTLKDKGVTVFFRRHGLSYQWTVDRDDNLPNLVSANEATGQSDDMMSSGSGNLQKVYTYRIDMLWNDAKENVLVSGIEPIEGVTNYYLSHCKKGVLNVESYKKLVYNDIYPGINLEYYINEKGHLKYDVILQAGADPSLLSYSYMGGVPIFENGKIRINTPLGFMEEQVPLAWIAGSRDEKVNVRYRKSRNGIGFEILRQNKPVVLDPEIIWATYYGGTVADLGNAVRVDGAGNVYLAGETSSTGSMVIAAAPGCITSKSAGVDAFVVKLNSEGTARSWATYYGTAGNERAKAMAIDPSGNIFIAGTADSNSNGFPTTGYKPGYGGGNSDAFLVKFSDQGACQWATYYGSNGFDVAYAVEADGAGDVYMAGYTTDVIVDIRDSPIGHDRTYSNPQFSYSADAFLVKFNSSGTSRLWATYYGGEHTEEANAIYVDAQNNVYLAGTASSSPADSQTDIATPGAYKTTKTNSGPDGFLVKFSETGTRQWGTYFGGTATDEINSITIDPAGNICIGGTTNSTDLGTTATAYQQFKGGVDDGFVAKLNNSGSSLLWASYFGGPLVEKGVSIAVDAHGNVFLAGETASLSGIAFNGIQNMQAGNIDAYLVEFNSNGEDIQWSTYYGGTNNDYGLSIAKDFSGIYLAGYTASTTLNKAGMQPLYGGGGSDAFLTKVGVAEITNESFPPTAEKDGTTPVAITLNRVGGATVKLWSRGISGPKDTWTIEPLSPSTNTFTKNLTETSLTDPLGLTYYFEITDATQAILKSSTGNTHLRYNDGEITLPNLHFGDKVSNYQIISTPLVFDNQAVTTIFDELGPYNRKQWRLFSYYEDENREYSAFSNIEPGLGYWLIIRNTVTIDLPDGQTVPASDDSPFIIPLTTGWNLIGNPYDFKISWQDVLDYNNGPAGVGALTVFSAGVLTEQDVLDRYQGGFVRSDGPFDLEIPVLRNDNLGGRRKEYAARLKNSIDQAHWEVSLIISNKELVNELGGIGMHPQATLAGKDAFDRVNVPLIEGMGFFALQVDHPEVNESFSKDVVPTDQNYIWRIDIRRDDPIPLTLKWENNYFGSGEKQLYLFDPTTTQVVDMRSSTQMEIGARSGQVWAIFGDQSYVDEVLNEELSGLGNPYPVPSNSKIYIPLRIPNSASAVDIKMDVFDTMGKEVSNLLNKPLPSGQHTVEWESKQPGIYFVQVRMGDRTVTKKVVIY